MFAHLYKQGFVFAIQRGFICSPVFGEACCDAILVAIYIAAKCHKMIAHTVVINRYQRITDSTAEVRPALTIGGVVEIGIVAAIRQTVFVMVRPVLSRCIEVFVGESIDKRPVMLVNVNTPESVGDITKADEFSALVFEDGLSCAVKVPKDLKI